MAAAAAGERGAAIHWFRKGLRLHDNPALLEACRSTSGTYPVFVLDPKFTSADIMSANRFSFLLESLEDLDSGLRKIGSRLFVVRGKPEEQLPRLARRWDVSLVPLESDKTGPYSKLRDANVFSVLQKSGVRISQHTTHTIYDADRYLQAAKGQGCPKSYQSFCKLFDSMGTPREPFPAPVSISSSSSSSSSSGDEYGLPTLQEMRALCGRDIGEATAPFKGGETEALRRLQEMVMSRPAWVAAYEKPNTAPNALLPSTTVLSPYLTMGCLSSTMFWHALDDIYMKSKKHTLPPMSLHGQVLWREWFYLCAATTPNFGKMEGNPYCKQIPWERDEAKVEAWKNGQTGFPFIDAIMTQLRVDGWIHHLARHAVACFLTRGDLWQHWEEGIKVFELWLLDGDYALNAANWQWLSCSRFFHQYGRCYSPVAFGKKTDPDGTYIKKWLPQLAKLPSKYIYEPWTAPLDVQRAAGCIVGKDYPRPIVADHTATSKANMERLARAYGAASKEGGKGDGGDEGAGGAALAKQPYAGKKKKTAPASEAADGIQSFFLPNKKHKATD
jgi:cryptochrome